MENVKSTTDKTLQLHIERWVFTQAELDTMDKPTPRYLLRSDDEFLATVPDCELPVLVCRNGTVTNRWSDGTAGVSDEIKELADHEETLYDANTKKIADTWQDVVVDGNGVFVGFLRNQDIQVVVVVEGGNVQSARASYPIFFDVLDYDNAKEDPDHAEHYTKLEEIFKSLRYPIY